MDHAGLDEVAENQAHLPNRQRPRKGHHHETIFIARHRFQNIGGVADLPPSESRVTHSANQFINRSAAR